MESGLLIPFALWTVASLLLLLKKDLMLAFRLLNLVILLVFQLFWGEELLHGVRLAADFSGWKKMVAESARFFLAGVSWTWSVVCVSLLLSKDSAHHGRLILFCFLLSLAALGVCLYSGFYNLGQ